MPVPHSICLGPPVCTTAITSACKFPFLCSIFAYSRFQVPCHAFNFNGDQWALMRSSWTDINALCAAMKGSPLVGHQTHGDLDCGDFVLDALGTPWAGELGSGDYNVLDYFDSEAQNAMMRQVPAVRASEQLEAAWDREVGVPPGVRTDSKTGCSSHTGLATRKQRVGAHARALLRSAVRPWAGEGM